jgi:hypothetical protein
MKKYFLYIIIVISFIYSGCDKPGPTELMDDPNNSENLDVEIIAKDFDNEFYSNGFDTSGVTEDIRNFASIISISGIKLTRNGQTNNITSALTMLFDKTKPCTSPRGIVLGYKTITPGIVKFDDVTARLTNYRVRFLEDGVLIDSILGKKYELFNVNGRSINDPFIFPYNSTVAFSFNPFIGQSSGFNIVTPKEITGNVKIVNLKNQNRLNAELTWVGENVHNFSVILGGVRNSNQQVVPFFRIKTKDDGSLIIPHSILKNIPKDKFNRLSFTFVRKYDMLTSLQNTDLYVVSQSIHTIIVELP